MGEKDADCGEAQQAGGPSEPGAHDDGSALLFISLSVRWRVSRKGQQSFLKNHAQASPLQQARSRGGEASRDRVILSLDSLLLCSENPYPHPTCFGWEAQRRNGFAYMLASHIHFAHLLYIEDRK